MTWPRLGRHWRYGGRDPGFHPQALGVWWGRKMFQSHKQMCKYTPWKANRQKQQSVPQRDLVFFWKVLEGFPQEAIFNRLFWKVLEGFPQQYSTKELQEIRQEDRVESLQEAAANSKLSRQKGTLKGKNTGQCCWRPEWGERSHRGGWQPAKAGKADV